MVIVSVAVQKKGIRPGSLKTLWHVQSALTMVSGLGSKLTSANDRLRGARVVRMFSHAFAFTRVQLSVEIRLCSSSAVLLP